jgi:hypothetical protein
VVGRPTPLTLDPSAWGNKTGAKGKASLDPRVGLGKGDAEDTWKVEITPVRSFVGLALTVRYVETVCQWFSPDVA